MKLRQYLTVFPSHFNNIFLIFQTFTEFNKKLWDFAIGNEISQNFSGIELGFCEVEEYFVDFQFHFWYFQKMTPKFQFYLYRFKILKFQAWQWQKFKKLILQLLEN